MTKEGSSYQNPVRFRNSQTNSDNYEKAVKIFESQTPGKFVQDALNVYYCTTYKSTKGEPIWNRIDQSNGQLLGGRYILINTGDAGTKPESKTLSGKKISYTIPGVNLRLNAGRTYDKKAFGSFIFILLTSADEVAPVSPVGTSPSSVNATVGSSEYTFVTNLLEEQKRVQEMYAQMRTDSNGRSGFGATLPKKTPASIQGAPQGPSINGPGVFVPTSPSPKTPSVPGAPSSGKKSTPGGQASSPSLTPNSPSLSTVVVRLEPDRNIFTGQGPYNTFLEKPYIQQTSTVFEKKYDEKNIEVPTKQRIVRRHVFDIIPNSFEFSQLSSTWNEIERGGNYPLVDWSKYNLTKCSFRFLVAGRRIDEIDSQKTTVNDGMDVSVDAEIENIRAIAGSPSPVIFYNFNKLLSTSYRFPYLENTRGIQWVIADLSITATRLTPNGRGIAAAEVSITLNEYPEIARDIVRLPPLVPDNPVPKQCKPKPCTPVKPKRGLITDTFSEKPDSLLTPEKKE